MINRIIADPKFHHRSYFLENTTAWNIWSKKYCFDVLGPTSMWLRSWMLYDMMLCYHNNNKIYQLCVSGYGNDVLVWWLYAINRGSSMFLIILCDLLISWSYFQVLIFNLPIKFDWSWTFSLIHHKWIIPTHCCMYECVSPSPIFYKLFFSLVYCGLQDVMTEV